MRARKARRVTSKAQWAWMYSTHKSFAHRWADRVVAEHGKKTGYRALPPRKGVRTHI